jgi:ferric-dicitrate binding protein FerR (iron transport regulator)
MMSRLPTIALLGIGVLCTPAFGANPAHPGTLNYIEGAAYLNGKLLNEKDVGSVEMNAGEALSTMKGKAEILLTPGVFLRLDDDSAVKMISPDITRTQVELDRGRAAVEVDELHDQNDLEIVDAGVTTQLVKTGYYEFDASHPTAMVFKGKAAVEVGDGKYKVVKNHHEFALAGGAKEKPADFNVDRAEDDLYNWSFPSIGVFGRG